MTSSATIRVATTPLTSRNWAEIDLHALRHNVGILRSRYASAPNRRVMAVVKADAYGHGMQAVVPACAAEGITDFGVASVAEALTVRELAPSTASVYLLSPAIPEEADDIVLGEIVPLVSDLSYAEAIARAARKRGKRAGVHVEVDTGIGRAGVAPDALPGFLSRLDDTHGIIVTGLSTHFARADEDAADVTRQDELFAEALRSIGARAAALTLHSDNSPAALLRKENKGPIYGQNLWLTRPGLLLYGIEPAEGLDPEDGFQPVLSLRVRVALCRELAEGASISYGRTFRVPPGGGIYATLPIGYGDGYPRALSGRGWAIVAGERAPICGRVCMDQLVVDVTAVSGVVPGDVATMIGSDGSAQVSALDLAVAGGLTPHELTTCITARVPRFVLNA